LISPHSYCGVKIGAGWLAGWLPHQQQQTHLMFTSRSLIHFGRRAVWAQTRITLGFVCVPAFEKH